MLVLRPWQRFFPTGVAFPAKERQFILAHRIEGPVPMKKLAWLALAASVLVFAANAWRTAHWLREPALMPLLDAVRGAALGGILLANLMSFFAVSMLGEEQRLAMSWGWAGEQVLFAINWLVEGKFYSVFSILLGIGFALQAGRSARRGASPVDFARFFRRRMWVLVAIGLVHMVFMWAGDILTLYGVMGLLLPSLARLRGGVRAALIAALFLVPLGTHALIVSTEGRLDPRTPFAAAGTALRERAAGPERTALDLFAHGSGADYYVPNVSTAVVRPGAYLQQGRPAKVLFLFVLGAWLGAGVTHTTMSSSSKRPAGSMVACTASRSSWVRAAPSSAAAATSRSASPPR